jgi:hypothetical protein
MALARLGKPDSNIGPEPTSGHAVRYGVNKQYEGWRVYGPRACERFFTQTLEREDPEQEFVGGFVVRQISAGQPAGPIGAEGKPPRGRAVR